MATDVLSDEGDSHWCRIGPNTRGGSAETGTADASAECSMNFRLELNGAYYVLMVASPHLTSGFSSRNFHAAFSASTLEARYLCPPSAPLPFSSTSLIEKLFQSFSVKVLGGVAGSMMDATEEVTTTRWMPCPFLAADLRTPMVPSTAGEMSS